LVNKTRKHGDDLRGASRLAIEATKGVTSLVEAMHRTIASGPDVLGRPLALPVRVFTAPVYASIRAVTDLVGAGIDVALAQLEPLLGESAPGAERDALLAVVNGVLGDHLSNTANPLAIEMRLRQSGQALEISKEELNRAFPSASSKLLVLVHGSCASDRQWTRRGHDHGAALARDLGYSSVYLHYNSGRHISTNGAEFAELLERLVAEWPAPIDELALLGHSMGGLVSRGACHTAEAAGHRWRGKLRALVCLGSPHHGAPLERGGQWVQTLLGISRYSAPFARLGRIRSAGVTDMRFGNVLDDHWQGRDRFDHNHDPRLQLKLPEGVECYAIAATTATEPSDRLPGDGLVPVDSALGRHARPELSLDFPEAHRWIGFGMNHFDLLDRADVYDAIRKWLSW
jgi:pimeloyl-ACP methyl ester carboxylesterase